MCGYMTNCLTVLSAIIVVVHGPHSASHPADDAVSTDHPPPAEPEYLESPDDSRVVVTSSGCTDYDGEENDRFYIRELIEDVHGDRVTVTTHYGQLRGTRISGIPEAGASRLNHNCQVHRRSEREILQTSDRPCRITSHKLTILFSKRQRITLRLLYAMSRPSVCLSVVCLLSVTLVHPTQAVELFGNFFSPYDSPGTLLFWCQKSLVGDAPFPLKFAFKVTHPLSNSEISTNIGS